MSDEPRYPSRYAPGQQVTVSQWLAEEMCRRQAAKQGTSLPNHFWRLRSWEKPYRLQILQANRLLKLFSPEVISRALRSPDGRKVHSLAASWLDELCYREKEALEVVNAQRQAAAPTPTPEPAAANLPRRAAAIERPNSLSSLKDL